MASKVFITATDTEAGKTWVTASAIRSLLKEGQSAKALKPIACGLDAAGQNEDIDALLSAQSLSDADQVSLYRYALPAAPSQAAASEGQVADTDTLIEWCESQSADVDTCLIEGVGGLMVPITDNWLVSEWIEAMHDAEVWLVVSCKLGDNNQTLLTLEKLKQIGRTPTRIFFNATKPEQNNWIEPTRKAIEHFLDQGCTIHCLRFGEEASLNG